MQIVIDLPEDIYKHIKEVYEHSHTVEAIYSYIYYGKPLPKGHGRLIDADKLKDAFIKWSMAVQGFFTDSDIASIVYNSPIIIEADKESEDKE